MHRLYGAAMTTEASTRVPVFTIGDRLRKAREEAGLDQGDFAIATGISRGTISNYERDEGTPKLPYLTVWAMRTGVPVKWLQTGEYPDPTGPGADECAIRDLNPEPADVEYSPADLPFPGLTDLLCA